MNHIKEKCNSVHNEVYFDLPNEFDPFFYSQNNLDLDHLSSVGLEVHFIEHGINEGRMGSPFSHRGNFLNLVQQDHSVLEIGPFYSPLLRGINIKYFDVLDRKELIRRAKEKQIQDIELLNRIPNIDYVSPTGDMTIINEKFKSVISSHNIEHHPDLVKHLRNVSRILEDDGCYFCIVPDKRYCFDHFISTSTIADVINAHLQAVIYHSVKSVIEHRAFTTHNDSVRHWNGDHGAQFSPNMDSHRLLSAIQELESHKGKYLDVHAWQFTPSSFKDIMLCLYNTGYTDLYPMRVYQTPRNTTEFCAILKKKPRVDS